MIGNDWDTILKEEMEKHVRCFNMEGLTTKIMNAED